MCRRPAALTLGAANLAAAATIGVLLRAEWIGSCLKSFRFHRSAIVGPERWCCSSCPKFFSELLQQLSAVKQFSENGAVGDGSLQSPERRKFVYNDLCLAADKASTNRSQSSAL